MMNQKGFSLPELLIAVAIIGLIVSFLGTAVYQILNVTEYGSDKMLATHELQNTASWISLDGQMATTATGGSTLLLTLPDASTITYTVFGTKLCRLAGISQMTLAQNISDVEFLVDQRTNHVVVGSLYEDRNERTITMTVTSSPPGRQNISEQRAYKIYLRPTAPAAGTWRAQ